MDTQQWNSIIDFLTTNIYIFLIIEIILLLLVITLFVKVSKLSKHLKKQNETKINNQKITTPVPDESIKLPTEKESLAELEKAIEKNEDKSGEFNLELVNSEEFEKLGPKKNDEISDLIDKITNDKYANKDNVKSINDNTDLFFEKKVDTLDTENEKINNLEETLDNLIFIKKKLVDKVIKYNNEIQDLEFSNDPEKNIKKNLIINNLKAIKEELKEYNEMEKEVLEIINLNN